MPNEFDDFIDRIKKYFKLDSNIFDIDFLFIPESGKNLDISPKDSKIKGFKISYHFESGMENPEIKIEGDIDEKKIQDYLKGIDISQYPTIKKLVESRSIKEIDASKLSLEANEINEAISLLEPHTEINDYNDYTEILLEIPGMSEKDIKIDFSEEGSKLIFNAENETRKYTKNIYLPFASSSKDYDMEVKNGLAIILVTKSDNK